MPNQTDPYINYFKKSIKESPFGGSLDSWKQSAFPTFGLEKSLQGEDNRMMNSIPTKYEFPKITNLNRTIEPKLQSLPQKTVNQLSTPKLDTSTLATPFESKSVKKDWLKNAMSSDIGKDVLSVVPQVGELAITALGGKEADRVTGGEQLFSKGTDAAWNIALKTGNPYAIAGAGVLKGLDWVNRFAGKTANVQQTKDIGNIAGYGTEISTNAGKKSTLLGSLKKQPRNTNQLTKQYDIRNLLASKISSESSKNLQTATNTFQDITQKNLDQLYQNPNKYKLISAKSGSKLQLTKIKKKVTKKLQTGGKLEGVNLIPSGALHKELNRLGLDTTKKGIPVVMQEGGELNQIAEIEREELILHLNLTKQLEELKKQYDNGDEFAAIEAGKILTQQILENTNDNTNLLNTI